MYFLFSKSSLAATSKHIETSLPGLKPAFSIEIKINSILTKNSNPLNFKILINNKFYKNFNLKNLEDLNNNTIFIDMNKNAFNGNIFHIKFLIENPITKLELLKSPDARMLGILVESIILK